MHDKIYNFLLKENCKIEKDVLKKFIILNNFIVLFNKEEIIAVGLFDHKEDMIHVVNTVIAKEYRNLKTLKKLINNGLKRYPYVKMLKWERELKYPTRADVSYSRFQLIGETK